jgi:hypothetical protein
MMGEISSRRGRTAEIPKGAILRRRAKGRGAIAPFVSRLRARGEVPSSGRIVFRAASQILH